MYLKLSLPQHHGDLLFVFPVGPSSSYRCLHSPCIRFPFLATLVITEGFLRGRLLRLSSSILSCLTPASSLFCSTDTICFYFCLLTHSQSGGSKNRWKWNCLVCYLDGVSSVWWVVNCSCIHFHQVDGMDVISSSCFQDSPQLWNMKAKSSSLQRQYFLVSME